MPSTNGSSGSQATNGKTLWARQEIEPQERVTRRLRQIAEGLPDWDPLPPGEIVVRRPRRSY
jgi:hypothetical protein